MAQASTAPPFQTGPSGWRRLISWALFLLILGGLVYLLAQAISSWMAKVEQVNRPENQSQERSESFRQPVALVEVLGQDVIHAVDAQAMILPQGEEHRSSGQELPRILSPFPPRGQAGQSWGVPEVETAIAVAVFLRNDWSKLGLRHIRIDASGIVTEIRLVTSGGSEVLWGDFSGRGEEATPDEKRLRLVKYVSEYGSLDAPAGPYLFDPRSADSLLRTRRDR
jgi:hypothetical protein